MINSNSIIKSNNIYLLLLVFFLLITRMPVIELRPHIGLFIYIGLTIFLNKKIRTNIILRNNYRKFLSILLLVLILNVIARAILIGDWYQLIVKGYGVFVNYTFTLLAIYLISKEDEKLLKGVIIICLSIYCYMAYTTYVGCKLFPTASRELATGSSENASIYRVLNIGGFDFIYKLVMIHPLIPFLYKSRKLPFLIALPISLIFGLCIFESRYTTALILFCISLIVYLLPNKKGINQKIQFGILFIVILSFIPFLPSILLSLADSDFMNDYYDIKMRLYELYYSMTGQSGMLTNSDIVSRSNAYDKSFQCFIHNILTGGLLMGEKNGGHSFIMDTLAEWGIWGLLIIITYYKIFYKTFVKPYRGQIFYSFLIYTFSSSIILSFLNPELWLEALCFFFPLVIAYTTVNNNQILS